MKVAGSLWDPQYGVLPFSFPDRNRLQLLPLPTCRFNTFLLYFFEGCSWQVKTRVVLVFHLFGELVKAPQLIDWPRAFRLIVLACHPHKAFFQMACQVLFFETLACYSFRQGPIKVPEGVTSLGIITVCAALHNQTLATNRNFPENEHIALVNCFFFGESNKTCGEPRLIGQP